VASAAIPAAQKVLLLMFGSTPEHDRRRGPILKPLTAFVFEANDRGRLG